MRNHTGKLRGRTVLWLACILAVPLLGWKALPAAGFPRPDESGRADRAAARPSTPAQTLPAGDVERGRGLFMGSLHFESGAPPCMGCHSVADNGLLGGGAMGPNLTDVSTRLTQAEILEILSNRGPGLSPVMQPIYTDFPLTAQEQADLVAFLEAFAGQPEANREIFVFGLSLAGFGAAVALLGFVYRGRLRGVRKSLLKKSAG